MQFRTNNTERMRIDSSGNLLVGKTADNLTDAGQVFTTAGSSFTRSGGAACQFNRNTSDGEVVRISKDGTTVGNIGTNSGNIYLSDGARSLIVDGDTVKAGYSTGGDANGAQDLGSDSVKWRNLYLSGAVRCPDYRSEGVLFLTYDADDSLQIRRDNGAEAARFDSSGNLLVGTTSASGASAPDNSSTASDAGIRLSPTGFIGLGANQAPSGYFNRIGNDGDIVKFNKDGTTVGSIGATGGDLYIDGAGGQVKFYILGSSEYEMDGSQFFATTDNANDLGAASFRWDDVYATNGTIQTSDRNEKQDMPKSKLILMEQSNVSAVAWS